MGKLTKTTNATISSTSIGEITDPSDYGVYKYVDEQGNIHQVLQDVIPTEITGTVSYTKLGTVITPGTQEPYVIGISDEIPMGCGDVASSTEMVYAEYGYMPGSVI